VKKTLTIILSLLLLNSPLSALLAQGDGQATDSIAAEIDGSAIYYSSVDAAIRSLVTKIHTEIKSVYVEAINELLFERFAIKVISHGDSQAELQSVIKTYQSELDRLSTRSITQTHFLHERVARRYLAVVNKSVYKQQLEKLQQEGNLLISIPSHQKLEKPLNSDVIVAKSGPQIIYAGQIEKQRKLRLFQLRGELYFLRKRSLEKLVNQHLLAKAAKSQGLTQNELEQSLLKIKATERQIDEYIESQRALGKTVNRARARPYVDFRVRYSKREQLISSQRNKANIKNFLFTPERPSFPIDIHAAIGYTNITTNTKTKKDSNPDIVLFNNYRCTVCRQAYQQLDKLVAQDPKLKVFHFDFVKITDSVALDGALLANCAYKQGKYAEMREYLLNHPPSHGAGLWLEDEKLKHILKVEGINQKLFERCIDDIHQQETIAKATDMAYQIGFTDPPAFLIRGFPLSGFHTSMDLKDKLETLSEKLVP